MHAGAPSRYPNVPAHIFNSWHYLQQNLPSRPIAHSPEAFRFTGLVDNSSHFPPDQWQAEWNSPQYTSSAPQYHLPTSSLLRSLQSLQPLQPLQPLQARTNRLDSVHHGTRRSHVYEGSLMQHCSVRHGLPLSFDDFVPQKSPHFSSDEIFNYRNDGSIWLTDGTADMHGDTTCNALSQADYLRTPRVLNYPEFLEAPPVQPQFYRLAHPQDVQQRRPPPITPSLGSTNDLSQRTHLPVMQEWPTNNLASE